MKKILSVVMTVVIISALLCASLQVSSADSDMHSIEFEATYGQTEGRTILSMINEMRTGEDAWYWNPDDTTKTVCSGLLPLTYDYDLEKVAMLRAKEIALYYSHTRPDGTSCFTADEGIYSGYFCGENIAAGYVTAVDVNKGWREDDDPYSGQGHRRNMLNANFESVAIGHVYYNGYHYWVEIFSSNNVNPTPTPANDSKTDCSINVLESNIKSYTLKSANETVEIAVGETIPMPEITADIVLTQSWPGSAGSVKCNPEYSIEDESIASISSSGITGVTFGSTKMTCTSLKDSSLTVNLRTYVISSVEHNVTYDYATNGGTSLENGSASVAVTEGASIDFSPVAVKDGWSFIGWNTDKDAKTALNSLKMYNEDVTLYAIYSARLTAYFISFSGSYRSIFTVSNTEYNNGGNVNFVPYMSEAEYPGWTFLGYSRSTDTDGLIAEDYYIDSDSYFYGLYSKDITIDYDMQNTCDPIDSEKTTATINSSSPYNISYKSVTLANAPSRDGYSFVGWANADETKTYSAGETITIYEDITLHPVWEQSAESFTEKEGSTTVIKDNIIYGLKTSLTKAEFEASFVTMENVTVTYTLANSKRFLGTGSTVTVTSNITGEVVGVYTIVVYGDINGDGLISPMDITALNASLTGETDPLTGVYKTAGNINGDRFLNAKDSMTLNSVTLGLADLDQSTGKAI